MDDNEIEEERRLCYVAMTRAEKNLYLTACQRRKIYQSVMYNPVSRFIGEVPSDMIHQIPNYGLSDRKPKVKKPYDEYRQYSYDDMPTNDPYIQTIDTPYAPGAKVSHPDFGPGIIKKTEGSSDNLKLTIQFRQAGTKKIMLNYCDLELVSI